jgi:hypothetical protein
MLTSIGSITGPSEVDPDTEYEFSVSGSGPYNWTVPTGATIVSGDGTSTIIVTFAPGSNGMVIVTNGTTSASKDITLNEANGVANSKGVAYDFYPNPFVTQGLLKLPASMTGKVSIKVTDMTGLSWMDYNGIVNQEMQLGDEFPIGVYTVFINYNGQMSTFKVVKVE